MFKGEGERHMVIWARCVETQRSSKVESPKFSLLCTEAVRWKSQGMTERDRILELVWKRLC